MRATLLISNGCTASGNCHPERAFEQYGLPSTMPLQSSEPQFKDGSVYREKRPTGVPSWLAKWARASFIGGAAAHAAGFRRILVLCPPHLTRKWKREVEETVPQARAAIVTSITDLERLRLSVGPAPPLRGDVQGKGKAFLPLVPRRDPAVGRRRGPVGAGRADRGTLPGALLPLLSRSGDGQGRGSPDQRGAFPQAPRLRPVRLRALESEGRTQVVLSLLAIWSLKEEARGKAN